MTLFRKKNAKSVRVFYPRLHCLKSVCVRSCLVRIFPHSDWIRRDTPYLSAFSPNAGNTCQEKSEYEHSSRSDGSHISDEVFFEKRDYFQIPVSGHRGNFKNLQGVLIPPSAFSQTFMPAVYEQELWVNTSLILYWVKFWNLFLKTPKVSEKLSLNCLLIACQGILPWSRFDTENKNSCR